MSLPLSVLGIVEYTDQFPYCIRKHLILDVYRQ